MACWPDGICCSLSFQLCDLSKTFDVIDHDILLSKMNNYGIRGLANDWFKNYLSGRQQYVDIDGVTSNKGQIQIGVPQGSILGPLLYLLYVNDIGNYLVVCRRHHLNYIELESERTFY